MWERGGHRISILLLLGTLGLAGCGQEPAPDGPPFQVRDSAGVTIYDNSTGEWTETTAWRLSSEPVLAIGVFDGPEEYLLFQARGARRLSNGNILIANGGTHELRFYDSNGTHLRSVGREGEGPGEFRSLGEPWALGSDSLAIWDSLNRRLTVFDIDGELGRSFRLDLIPDVGTPTPRGILADNSLLVSSIMRSEMQPGISRDSILYARHSLEGASMATLIRRRGTQNNLASLAGGMIMGPVPHGTRPTVTVFGDRWYFGSGESWEIEVYSPDGALTHLFRRNEPNQPFAEEIKEEEDPEPDPGPQSDQNAMFEAFEASMPIPETFPAYRSFMVSDDGSLWVQNYLYPSEQPSWAVFRHDGRYLGVVETPVGADVTHIGEDFVLAIWEDDLGIQQVRMYELVKP